MLGTNTSSAPWANRGGDGSFISSASNRNGESGLYLPETVGWGNFPWPSALSGRINQLDDLERFFSIKPECPADVVFEMRGVNFLDLHLESGDEIRISFPDFEGLAGLGPVIVVTDDGGCHFRPESDDYAFWPVQGLLDADRVDEGRLAIVVHREHVETMGLDVVQGLRFAGVATVFAVIDLHLEILLVVDIVNRRRGFSWQHRC